MYEFCICVCAGARVSVCGVTSVMFDLLVTRIFRVVMRLCINITPY